MNHPVSPLQLRAYAGRENGLMIFGSPESLQTLAQQLIEFSTDKRADQPMRDDRAALLIQTVGPYVDVTDFQLSFHLQSPDTLAQQPSVKTRRNLPAPLWISLAGCALLGMISIAQWLLGLL